MAKSAPSRSASPAGGHLWRLAGHSFRQPAQALALLADGITGAHTEDERRALSARIAQVASGLGEMIDGMSLLARIETGELTPACMAMPIDACIAAVLTDLAAVTARSPGRIVRASTDALVVADRALMRQAVRGLVLCALQAAQANGPVEIAVERRGALVALTLDYAGRDPARALAEQAFVELLPAEGQSERPIMGLGLAFVARLAGAMGGSLEVDSDHIGRRRIALLLPAAPG